MTQISRPALAHIDGWGINTPNLDIAIRSAIADAGAGKAFTLFTLNLDHLAKLKDNEKFREAYRNADIVTADGAPVAWLARWQDPNVERATGADMLMPLLNAAADARLPVFLFGSSADVLTKAVRELGDHTDGLLDIAGTLAPSQSFDPEGPEADLAIAGYSKVGSPPLLRGSRRTQARDIRRASPRERTCLRHDLRRRSGRFSSRRSSSRPARFEKGGIGMDMAACNKSAQVHKKIRGMRHSVWRNPSSATAGTCCPGATEERRNSLSTSDFDNSRFLSGANIASVMAAKVLFYAPGLVDGGAERLWSCLASAIKARGFDVVFAQDFEAYENRSNLDASIPVHTLGRNHLGSVRALVAGAENRKAGYRTCRGRRFEHQAHARESFGAFRRSHGPDLSRFPRMEDGHS